MTAPVMRRVIPMAYEAPKDYVDVAERLVEFRAKHPEGTLGPLDPAKPFEIIRMLEGVTKDGKTIAQTFVVVVAAAYRTPDDPRPGIGMAWEIFPGRTPYTLGSELMNAETSAWGRAIIAVGAADAKRGIASAEEVRNRQAERDENPFADDATKGSSWRPPANPSTRKADRTRGPLPDDQWTTAPPDGQGPEAQPGSSTPQQWRDIAIKLSDRGLTGRDDKVAFCAEVAARPADAPPITSSKDLSYAEAEHVLKVAGG